MFGSWTLPVADLTTFGMPESKSTVSDMVDSHYAFINIVNAFFFLGICAALAYILLRFVKPAGEKAESDVSHNTPLEITWTVIPLILVVIMFWLGFRGYNQMIAAPADSYSINVQAQRWSWSFSYPDIGLEIDELHVPPGTPIRLVMTSSDVLHSFFVPEFRVKQDVVPGKISSVWFEPDLPTGTEPDRYQIYCTEYCGTKHSEMLASLYVHPTWESFEAWWRKAITFDPDPSSWVDNGRVLSKRKGCIQCHSVEPDAKGSWVGPSWVGLWGKAAADHPVLNKVTKSTENIAVQGEAGENYIMESINNPMAKIVVGYGEAMPIKKIKEDEVLYLIEYIKSLGKDQ